MNLQAYLRGERLPIDGVFGTDAIATAEVEHDFTYTVLIYERTSADVDGVRTGVVQDNLHVMAGIHQDSAHLRTKDKLVSTLFGMSLCNIGSGNGLVELGNNPLPEFMSISCQHKLAGQSTELLLLL